MRDFTLSIYRKLLNSFVDSGYGIDCFSNYVDDNSARDKIIILRHDVDKKPANALNMAKLEKDLGIKASYYFRIARESYDDEIIKSIDEMGHEVGYHYENLSEVSKWKGVESEEKLFELAFDNFRSNLEKFRTLCPVKTICMHGSPLSKWDNKCLWQKYDYRDLGIIGEPYFDIDFNKVLYLTDTGRRWNGSSSNIRDKVESQYQYNLESTNDIITAIHNELLPTHIMLNVHPQRWDDNAIPWIKELLFQNSKNIGKLLLKKLR